MVWVERPAVCVGAVDHTLAKLLGRPDLVARLAKATDVAVVIGAALRQRDDVIGNSRWRDVAFRIAVSTQGLSSKTTKALRYTTATTEASRLA